MFGRPQRANTTGQVSYLRAGQFINHPLFSRRLSGAYLLAIVMIPHYESTSFKQRRDHPSRPIAIMIAIQHVFDFSWENPFTLPRFSTTHSRDLNSQVALVLCPWREMHMGTTTPPRLAIVYLQTHVKAFAAGVVYNSMSLLLVRSVRSECDFKVISPPPSALATAPRDRTALLKRHIKLHSSRTAHCFMDII